MKISKMLLSLILVSSIMTSCFVEENCELCYNVLYFQHKAQDTIETGYFCGEKREYNNYNGNVYSVDIDSLGNADYNSGNIKIIWECQH